MLNKFAIILTLFSTLSCATYQDQTTLNLDSNQSRSNDKVVQNLKKPEEVDPQDIFEWQKYYKNNPSPAQAQKILRDIEQNPTPSRFSDRLQRARNVLAMGYRKESRELYSDLLREEPENIDVLIDMAHLYLGENNTGRALDYLNEAKKALDGQERPSKQNTLRYRYALALGYIQLKNKKKANQVLTELIKEEKKFIPAYAALAQSYLLEKKFAIADFIVKRGMDHAENDPTLLNILGVISLRKGKIDEAKSWIERSLSQNQGYVPALINRAYISIKRREYATAENDLQRSIITDPLNLDAQIALGLLYKKTGRMSAAKLALEKAMGIDPQNVYARYHLGSLLSDEFQDKNTALQLFYDVLQSKDEDSELKTLAKAKIQSIRDSRLYDRSADSKVY